MTSYTTPEMIEKGLLDLDRVLVVHGKPMTVWEILHILEGVADE